MTPEQIKTLQLSMLHKRFLRDFEHPIKRLILSVLMIVYVPRQYAAIKKETRRRAMRDFKRNLKDAYVSIKCAHKGHVVGEYKMTKWCKNCHRIFKKKE